MFHPGTELSGDAHFRGRVIRLTGVSVVALGLIWSLWARTLETSNWVGAALIGGWVLMPTLLALSLRWPYLRYGLVVPASLVSVALLAISISWRPDHDLGAMGWIVLTLGIVLGGTLGMWFWFRMAPVPDALAQPFSRGRWFLVGAHAALIVAGMVFIEAAHRA
jgi:hypothetical protein